MTGLTDPEFESVKERINSAIHELVFACEHAENDEIDSALDCLMTVHSTIASIEDELSKKVK